MASRLLSVKLAPVWCLCLSTAVAQTSTAMPASSATPSSQTTASPSGATAAPSGDPGEVGAVTRDPLYSAYVSLGMNPAAASYAFQQLYVTDSSGQRIKYINDDAIVRYIEANLPGDSHRPLGEYELLSLEPYFLDILSTGAPRDYQKSFLSVWNSYQSITPNAAESTRLHSVFNSKTLTATRTSEASTSTGLAGQITVPDFGAVTVFFLGVAAWI